MPDNWTIEDAPNNGWTIEDAPQAQEPSTILMPDLPGFKGGVPVSGSGATPTTIPSPASSGWTLEDAPVSSAHARPKWQPKYARLDRTHEQDATDVIPEGQQVLPDGIQQDENAFNDRLYELATTTKKTPDQIVSDLGKEKFGETANTQVLKSPDQLRWYINHYREGGTLGINWDNQMPAPSTQSVDSPIDVLKNPAPLYPDDAMIRKATEAASMEGDGLLQSIYRSVAGVNPDDVASERARREQFWKDQENRTEHPILDPVFGTIGTIAGGVDPTYFMAPGETVAGRVLAQAGIQGARDVAAQALEVQQGLRKGIDPEQVLGSAVTGAAFEGAIHGLKHAPTAIHDVTGEVPYTPKVDTPAYDLPFKTPTQKAAAIAQHIDTLTGDWQNAPEFVVYKTKAALAKADPELWGALQRDGATRAPGFFGEDSKVHIIAENVKDPAKISSLVYHEALGHAGLQEQFQSGLDDVLQSLYDTNHRVRGYADAYNAKYGVYTGPDAHLRASEEYLARQSENGPLTKSLMDKVVSYIRDFGRKNLGMDLRYTDREVRAILADAHSSIIHGKPEGIADPYGTAGNRYMYTGAMGEHSEESYGKLQDAMDREENGEDVGPGSQVHRDTGWFVAHDNHWRKEISDAPIEDKAGNLVEGVDHARDFVDKYYQGQGKGFVEHPPLPLPKVLDHPELYKLYPELRNVTVRSDASAGTDGSISGNTIKIDPTAPDHLGTLLHEVQHWIQGKEGFAKGGNLTTGIKNMTPEHLGIVSRRVEKYYQDRINKYTNDGKKEPSSLMAPFVEHWKGELKNIRRNLNSDDSVVSVEEARKQLASVTHLDRQAYDHLFGEVEARDTTNRKGLSPDQRKEVTPYTSEDDYIEPKDYIVRYMLPDREESKTLDAFNLEQEGLTIDEIADHILNSKLPRSNEVLSDADRQRAADATGLTIKQIIKKNPKMADPAVLTRAMDLLQKARDNLRKASASGNEIKLRDALIKHGAILEWATEASGNMGRALYSLRRGIGHNSLGVEQELRDLDLARLSDPKYLNDIAELIKSNEGNDVADAKVARDAVNPLLREDYLTSYHYASMLSGLGSLKHNIFGHLAGNLLNNLETAVAGLAGSTMKVFGAGSPDMITLSEMKYRTFGYMTAFFDAGFREKVKNSFKTGTVENDGGNATWGKGPQVWKVLRYQENLHSASYTFFGELEKSANVYAMAARIAKEEGLTGAKLSDRIAEIVDKITSATRMTKNEARNYVLDHENFTGTQSERKEKITKRIDELVNNPYADMREKAMLDANVTRFMGPQSWLEKKFSQMIAAPDVNDGMGRVGRFAVMNLVPFHGIQGQKVLSVLRRTPLAPFVDPYTRMEWNSGIAGRQRVISRMVMGTAALIWATNELEKHPIDFEKHKDLIAEIPLLNLMYMAKGIKDKIEAGKSEDLVNDTLSALGTIGKTLQDGTLMKGIDDYFTARDSKVKSKQDSYWGRQAQSWVPESAALREINSGLLDPVTEKLGLPNISDPVKRDTGGRTLTETLGNNVKAIIPGLSETLPERRTKLGQTVTSEPTQDVVEQEIQRLEGDKGTPIFLPKSQTEMEKQLKRKVSRREVQDYNKELGGNIHDNLQEWIQSPEWKTMSDADKIQTVKDVVKYWRGVKNASTAQEATGNDQWSVSQ